MTVRPVSAPRLASVAQILQEMLSAHGAAASVSMGLQDAIGLVLDQDIVVATPVPPQTLALRAGYAVTSLDLVGGSAYAPVPIAAKPPWIEAGEPLPPGADAVIPRDALSVVGPHVEILTSCTPGENVRRAGEDAPVGAILRPRGQVLRALDAALADAAGRRDVVARPVTIKAVLPAEARGLAPLFRLVAGARISLASIGDAGAFSDSAADLIIVATGAERTGEPEPPRTRHLSGGLALAGAETATVALLGSTPLLVAPPRVEALAALIFGLIGPYVDALTGRDTRPTWQAPLRHKLSSAIGFSEVALLRETMGAVEPVGVGTLSLTALSQADGYLVVPPESEGFPVGDVVEATRFE